MKDQQLFTGEARVRRMLSQKPSMDPAERAWFDRQIRRLRAWFDLQVGSFVASNDKDAYLHETLNEVLTGKSELSRRAFASEGEFEIALRRLLVQRSRELLDNGGT